MPGVFCFWGHRAVQQIGTWIKNIPDSIVMAGSWPRNAIMMQ